jgi:hypothetical protein
VPFIFWSSAHTNNIRRTDKFEGTLVLVNKFTIYARWFVLREHAASWDLRKMLE